MADIRRSEEHTSELQSLRHLVCRLLLEKKENFVTAIGAGTTYPDYKPAPFIISSQVEGVDMFFFNDTATTEIYTLSLHDALPILETHPARRHPIVGAVHDAVVATS